MDVPIGEKVRLVRRSFQRLAYYSCCRRNYNKELLRYLVRVNMKIKQSVQKIQRLVDKNSSFDLNGKMSVNDDHQTVQKELNDESRSKWTGEGREGREACIEAHENIENIGAQIKTKAETEKYQKRLKRIEEQQKQKEDELSDKNSRGPYRSYPLEIKERAIQLKNKGLNCSEISRRLSIPPKNIVRWCKNGATRRPGAGRKVMDPEMEIVLKEWIADRYEKGAEIDSFKIRSRARKISRIKQFEASAGWFKNFLRRHNLKTQYRFY